MPTVNKLDLSNTQLSEDVKKIISSRKYNKNNELTSSVPVPQILDYTYGNFLPSLNTRFDCTLKELRETSRQRFQIANNYLRQINEPEIKLPSSSAFNNCDGNWAEYCYSAFAWNYLADLNRTNRANSGGNPHEVYIYVKLPNHNSANNEWTQLLLNNITTRLSNYPDEKSTKIQNVQDPNYGRRFEMISSNPDFVILKYGSDSAQQIWDNNGVTDLDFYTDITNLNLSTTAAMDTLFSAFKGMVLPSENIQCFLSLKTSIRPDRRYQWIHEGDHVKTVLQWIMSCLPSPDPNLQTDDLNGKFFSISLSESSSTDSRVMDIGLVGSIIAPQLNPYWAVDKLFVCLDPSDVAAQINEMINF